MADQAITQQPDPSVATNPAYQSGTSQDTITQNVTDQGGTPTATARPGERDLALEDANRQKLLSSGELTAGGNEQLAMEKVNLATYGIENPTFGATISSDPARTEFASQTKELNNQIQTTNTQIGLNTLKLPEYQTYQDFTGDYKDLQQRSQDMYQNIVDTIQKDFDVRESEQKEQNRITAGNQTKSLARFGALGRSGSGMAFLKDVEVQNERELNKLLVQKSQVLIAAAEAAQARDLTLLNTLVNHSQSLTNQYNEVQQFQLQDSISTNNQLMQQHRFGWEIEDRYLNQMTQIIQAGTDISDADKRYYEEKSGLPEGFYDALANLDKKAKDKQDKLDDLDFQKSIIDLQGQVPEGKSFVIGDKTYSGWKIESDQSWKQSVTDDKGNVTIIKYDPETKQFTTFNAGQIGSSSSGSKLIEVDGTYYEYTGDGNAIPVVTKGGFENPHYEEGFDAWMKTIGGQTTDYQGKSNFQDWHTGVDIAAEYGTSITAFRSGKVTKIDPVGAGGYGKYIEVTGDDGKTYRYAHLSGINVTVGDSINEGMSIGAMGNTGNVETTWSIDAATGNRVKVPSHVPTDAERAAGLGSHLHFEVITPDKKVGSGDGSQSGNTSNQAYFDALQNTFPQGITDKNVDRLTNNLNGYLDRGDIEGAQDFIIREAEKSQGVTRQGQTIDLRTTVASIERIRTLLNDYVKKSGDTGILKGTLEAAAQKIGKTTDENGDLAYIKNTIDPLVAQYTKAVSGVQFSDTERETYKNFFPSIDKAGELNIAKIDSFVDQISFKLDSDLRQLVGSSVYDRIFNQPEKINSIQDYVDQNPDSYDAIVKTMNDNNYTEPQMIEFLQMLQSQGLTLTDL